ncbi:MAG: PilZ domain-containing protein [Pseudomonadota bacterium]|nr:PilZ domain-containing protein [Pseudomonadota bacterium]
MEQRVATRYSLQVPAHIETMLSGKNIRSYKWKTRDISPNGAFLLTNGQLLEKDTVIKVNLYLNTFSGSGSWIKMNGRVVRTESEGLGICFNGQYQFVSNAPDLDLDM